MRILCLCLLSIMVFADFDPEKVIFGPEFTFSSPKYITQQWVSGGIRRYGPGLRRVVDNAWDNKLTKILLDYCEDRPCSYTALNHTMLWDDGMEINFLHDVNVKEVKMNPMTLEEYRLHKTRIQEAVFDNMEKIGLTPQKIYGEGHISMDLGTAFDGDVKKLANFVTDMFNHPGMFWGVLEQNGFDAVPFMFADSRQKKLYNRLLKKVWNEQITTVDEFVEYFRNEVMKDKVHKFQMIKFHDALVESTFGGDVVYQSGARMEIRALRAQQSMDDFENLIEMFSRRIKYLDGIERVEFITDVGVNTKAQALSQFYEYVKGTNMEWERFSSMIPAKYKKTALLTDPKKIYEKQTNCSMFMHGFRRTVHGMAGGLDQLMNGWGKSRK
jgi:hypothetical protein